MRKLKKSWMIIGLVLIGAISFGVYSILAKQSEAVPYVGSAGKIVEVMTLEKRSLSDQISVLGTMKATDKRSLYIETADEVISLPYRVGDKVKKGDVVATFKGEGSEELIRQIEQSDLEIQNAELALSEALDVDEEEQILKLEAELSVVQKNQAELKGSIQTGEDNIDLIKKELVQLQSEAQANKALYEEGALSEKAYEDSKLQVQRKKTELQKAQETIKTLENQKTVLDKQKESISYSISELKGKASDATYQRNAKKNSNDIEVLKSKKASLQEELDKVAVELTSPMDGWISSIDVEEGQSVSSQMPILSIVQNKEMLVQADLSAEEVSYVEVGQKCQIEYWGKEKVTGEGFVKRIAPSVVTETKSNGTVKKSIPVEIEITSLSKPLIDGMEVDVEICTLEKENVIVVPKTAIQSNEVGKYYVYVVDESNSAKKVPVSIVENTKEQAVVEGLKEGENLIISLLEEGSLNELQDGEAVRYSK